MMEKHILLSVNLSPINTPSGFPYLELSIIPTSIYEEGANRAAQSLRVKQGTEGVCMF